VINPAHGELSVGFVRLDAEDTDYSKNGSFLKKTATVPASTVGGPLTFATTEQYPSSGDVKLIGWYPSTGTFSGSGSAGTVTFASIGGETDIMATALRVGSKSSKITSITFNHLLSQVRVEAYYEDDDNATTAWGNITSVTFIGKKQDFVITLPPAGSPNGTEATPSTDSSGNLDLVKKDPSNNDESTNSTALNYTTAIETTPTLLGYALFAPKDHSVTDQELEIKIVTVKKTTTVKVAHDFKASESYVITLKFGKEDLTIKPSVTIGTWGSGTNPALVDLNPIIP
jgi:hypothetical protein